MTNEKTNNCRDYGTVIQPSASFSCLFLPPTGPKDFWVMVM